MFVYMMCINRVRMCKISLGVTVTFNQSTYTINENSRMVQPVITLSNPAAFDITIRIRDRGRTALS